MDHDPLRLSRSEQPTEQQTPGAPSEAGLFPLRPGGVNRRLLHAILYIGLALGALGVFIQSDRSGSYFNDNDVVQGNTITMGDPLPTPIPEPTETPTAPPPSGGPGIDNVEEDAPVETEEPACPPEGCETPEPTPAPTDAPPEGCQMDDPALCEPHEPDPSVTLAPHDPPGEDPTAEPPAPTEEPTSAPTPDGGDVQPPDDNGDGGVISIGMGGSLSG